MLAEQNALLTVTSTLILILVVIISFCDAQELLLVQALWTNGAKNPDVLCRNDVNSEKSFIQGFGALSKAGMIQQHQLGQNIYEAYAINQTYLDKAYNSKQIYIRSSGASAALASAYANLIGMYYNREQHKPNDDYPNDLQWPKGFVPVPVHSAQLIRDYEVNSDITWQNQYDVFERIKNSTDYKNEATKLNRVMTELAKVCRNPVSIFDIILLHEIVEAEKRENLKILFSEEQQKQLNEIYVKSEELKFNLKEYASSMAMVTGGNLMWRVMENMKTKIKCLNGFVTAGDICEWMSPLKYHAFSTDITMIRSILGNLNNQSDLFKKSFTRSDDFVALIWELFKNNSAFVFKLKFQTDPSASFETVTTSVPGCSTDYCSVETLAQFANTIHDVSAFRTSSLLRKKKSNWIVKKVLSKVKKQKKAAATDPEGNELKLVQAVWRHGDRSPVSTFVCKNDPNKESSWKQGYDQLSFNGMRQHMKFGSLIYDRYATKLGFLSKKYSSDEVYVRSTDYNRTIISAISSLIGTFYNKGTQAGIDYPNATEVERWPSGYVPIPIFTHYRSDEPYADTPFTKCERKEWLKNLSLNSPEVTKVMSRNKELMDTVNKICGENKTLMNLNGVVDTWMVEDLYNKTQIFDAGLFNELKGLDIYAEKVKAGALDSPYIQNMDLSIEIPKIRGGPLLWHLIDNFRQKINCENPSQLCFDDRMKTLKYYIYSAHDVTLNALFLTLGCFDKLVFSGIPNYGAGVLFELWQSPNGLLFVRVLYHRGEYESDFEDITDTIKGCPAEKKCLIEFFLDATAPYVLPMDDVSQACSETERFSTLDVITTVTTTTNPTTKGSSRYNGKTL